MRKIYLLLLTICTVAVVNGQVTTNGGSGLAPTYTSLANAITALNAATITSPVIITLNVNETAPNGTGYYITATGTAANTITIEGSGSNTVTAGLNSAGGNMDAIFKIVGGDYITIRNFTMQENAANIVTTAGATNTMTEAAVLLIHASATDGAQNNTVRNCIISLSSAYANAVGVLSTSASTTSNASPGANTATDASSTAGTNSNNSVYSLVISQVAYGVMFICPPITATVFETGNTIGAADLFTGNVITYGNNTVSSAPWNRSSAASGGIVMRNGAGNAINFNTINTIAGLTINSTGVFVSSGSVPVGVTYTTSISGNLITMTNTGTGSITGVDFGHGIATGTIAGSNNNITLNQNATAAVTTAIIGIKANYAAASATLNTNTVVINQNFSPIGTATNSSPITGMTVPSGTTGTPTMNVLGNSITINRAATVPATFTGTLSGTVTGLQATTAATTMNIGALGAGNNNTVTIKEAAGGGAGTTAYTSSVNFIDVSAGHGTANVVNNTLNTTGSTIRSTGTLQCVNPGGTVTALYNIKNNTATIDRVAASGTIAFTLQSTSPSNVADTVSNNNITFTNLSGTTIANGISQLGGPSASGVKSICNNTINITGNNTGTTKGIAWGYSAGAKVSGNSVTISCAAPTVIGLDGTSTSAGGNGGINSNVISLTSSTVSPTSMIGITGGSTGPFQIANNTFAALNFTGVITGAPVVSGIALSVGTGNNINNNIVNNISVGAATSTANPVIDGILISGGVSTNVFKNKIYGIASNSNGATGVVNGIRISGGGTTANNIYNNLIGDITAAPSTNPDAVRGISITSTTATTTHNVYYNSIYINGSGGTNFGSSGIFHTTGAATTSALNLRNNIIVNVATSNGAGRTVALRRNNATLTNYASTSNNNLLYAGTPSATNFIYFDGTNSDQNLSSYKIRVSPRDASSVTENPPFLSTSGVSSNFLHLDPVVATQAESGGTSIPGFTDDYDGDTRNATTPDIGADEITGIPADLAAPNITYTPLVADCLTGDKALNGVTITDFSGVPTSGALQPRVYYRKNSGTWFSSQGSLITGTGTNGSWNFTIVAADMGGLIGGDQIQYYVIAQDIASPTNIASNPIGAVATDVNTVTTAPASPNIVYVGQNLAGTYTVGAGGNFPNLTVAIAQYNSTCGITAPVVFELLDINYDAGETFPLQINNAIGASSTNTLTIRPTLANTVINGNNGTSIFTLNGSQYVTIDGRINSSGTIHSLTVTNTNAAAPAVTFINDATGGGIIYADLKSDNTSTTSGVILFSTTTGANGNDNILIDNCNIRPNAVNPTNGIFSLGTTTSTAHNNSNNTVSNNNIFDFYNSTSTTNGGTGINVNTGNTDWTITGNSLYQTASRTTFGIGATVSGINVTATAGGNFTVSNNFVGGGAPLCGGAVYNINAGTGTPIFRGIFISVGNTPVSTVQNNTVRNISLSSASASTSNSAFSILNGGLNITNNTVGSQSATGDITFSTTGTAASFSGFLVGTGITGQGVINITNNNVGGINVTGTGTASLRGIFFQTSGAGASTQYTVSGNTIGSTTVVNSLQNSTNAQVLGIAGLANQTTSTNVISNNTVANLTSTNNLIANAIFGILAQGSTGGIYSTTGNTIRNLTTSTTATGVGASASLFGIQAIASTTAGQTVSQNTVYALSNTDPTIAVGITGINYTGPTTGTNVVSRNLVYDLSVASTSATADVRGINFASGIANVHNNMVRIGNGIANGNIVTGLYEVAGNAGSGIYYNSVFVGGSVAGTQTGNSYAFRSDVTTNARTFQNNIFMNARSNATTGGKHYAVRVAGTAANPAGLNLNYNDYFVSGTGGVFGFFNSADVATIAAWQTAVGQDALSLNTDPNFIAPTAATPNLHITNGSTVLESAANPIAGIAIDYDNDSRPGTPSGTNSGVGPDIGADEFDGLNPNLCIGTPAAGGTATASTATICAGSNVTFTLTGATSGPGIGYQWQTSPAGAGTWTNVGGAISTVASFPITGNTDVRCLVTCVPSGLSTPSTIITVNGVNCQFDITKSTGISYSSISGTGTSMSGWKNGSTTDDNLSTSQPIGFSFPYKGANYTNFSVSTNGYLTFNVGTSATGSGTGAYGYDNTQFTNTTGTLNSVAPYYDDLVCQGNPGTAAGLASAMKYQMSGSAPNRVLTVEWIGMETFGNAGPNLNFQIKLHETTGQIEYVYGTMEGFNGTADYGYSYTLGLNNSTVSGTPTVIELQTQQVENVQNFANTAKNNLGRVAECNISYTFIPNNYSGAGSSPGVPANDETGGAINLVVNPSPCTFLCGTYYTSKNATASAGITACGAGTPGTADDDVWFIFTATTTQQTITVKGGGGYDAVVQLFSDAGTTAITCVNATGNGLTETINASGLSIGNLYYVRVYHAGTGSNNATTATGTGGVGIPDFSICVNEVVPPPLNDDPCGAVNLTVGSVCTPYSDNSLPSTTSFLTATTTTVNGVITPTCSGAGSVNDVWFTFVAPASGSANCTVTPVSGVNPALQLYSITSGTCGGLDLLLATAGTCINSNSTGVAENTVFNSLTPGATYYIRVYHHPSGTGGAPVSNSQFNICVFAPLPGCPATFTPANNATPCQSATVTTLSWTAATNATGYDVYFDAGAGPATTLVSTNQAGLTHNAGILASGQYSWRIEAKNANGTTVCSNLSFTVQVPPSIDITPVGPINICAPGTQVLSLGSTTASSPTYQWQNNGVNIAGQTGTSYTATATGIYTLVVTDGVTGCTNSSNAVSVNINPAPGAITITPASATVCPTGPAQLLTASGGSGASGTSGTASASSGSVNILIPDTQVPATDTLANTVTISGVPAGANLDSVIVTLNINHIFDADLDIFLQGPNGQKIELSTDNGSTGDNYTGTRITTDPAKPSITTGSAPFTGTFRAEGYLNAGNLASLLNGGWILKIYDDFSGDQGTLVDWSIDVAYTVPGFVWTPNGAGNGLYTDAGATTLYTGGPAASVYALPSANITYTVTATSGAGCSNSQTVAITLATPVSAGTVSGTTPICIGNTTTYSSNGTAGGTWSSTNTGVATVDPSTGLVTAIAAGTTDITYTVSTGCGSPVSSFKTLTVLPADALEWTGAINTDWNNAGNWTCNTIPTTTSIVLIKSGLTNYPVISVNVNIKSLTTQPGASVTVTTGFTLMINGQ